MSLMSCGPAFKGMSTCDVGLFWSHSGRITYVTPSVSHKSLSRNQQVATVTVHCSNHWATGDTTMLQQEQIITVRNCASVKPWKNAKQWPVHSHHLHFVVLHDWLMTCHRASQPANLLPASSSHVCAHSLLAVRPCQSIHHSKNIFHCLIHVLNK